MKGKLSGKELEIYTVKTGLQTRIYNSKFEILFKNERK